MSSNDWPFVAVFLFGTLGALYLIRVGLTLRREQESLGGSGSQRPVMSWRAHIIFAIALWLLLALSEVVFLVVSRQPQP